MTVKACETKPSSDQGAVADTRYQLFNVGLAHINDEIEHRYFLEAIC